MNLPNRIRSTLRAARALPPLNRTVGTLIRAASSMSSRVTTELARRWPVVGDVDVDLAGVRVRLRTPGDDAIANQLFYGDAWETGELRAWRALTAGARTVLDVGANTGVYSLLAGRAGAQVHAFEPNPHNVERFRENVRLNHLESQVTLNEAAVGAASGEISIAIPDTGASSLVSSAISEFTQAYANGASCRTIRVPLISLDDFVRERAVSVDLVKVDVESYEMEVFRGGARLLERHGPAVLCEIFDTEALLLDHPELSKVLPLDRRHEAERFFTDLGYTAYAVGDRGLHRLPSMVGVPANNFVLSRTRSERGLVAYEDTAAIGALLGRVRS